MSVRRSLFLLVILTFAVPVGVAFLNMTQAVGAQQEQLATIERMQKYVVAPGNVERTVSALGTVEADEVVNLSFQTTGLVAEVLVEEGDYVLPGDLLIRLDNDTERIDHEQAVLALQRADVNLREVYEPVDEDDLRVAEANLSRYQGEYSSIADAISPEDIAAAELRYEQAVEAWEGAKAARGYVNTGVGEEEVHLFDAKIGQASFEMEVARLQLEALRKENREELWASGARIAQARLEVEQVQAGPTEFEIDNATVALSNAEAKLIDAEVVFNRTQLTTPVEGIVTRIYVEEGQPVGLAVPVIEITDRSQLWLTAEIDETDIDYVSEGLAAFVRLDALPDDDLSATVDRIALLGKEIDGVVSYDTRLALDGSDERVRVGMTGEAFVILETRDSVMIVPNNFIHTLGSRSFVDVIQPDGSLVETEIILGLRGDGFSEVESGLVYGDVIGLDTAN